MGEVLEGGKEEGEPLALWGLRRQTEEFLACLFFFLSGTGSGHATLTLVFLEPGIWHCPGAPAFFRTYKNSELARVVCAVVCVGCA